MSHPSPQADPPDRPAPALEPIRVETTLLPVLLPILGLGLIVSLVVQLVLGAGSLVIVDGGLTFDDEGASAWLKLGVTVMAWLLALTAGAVVAVGVRRGRAVGPRAAAMVALRQSPALALGLCVAVGVSIGVIWAATGVASAGGSGSFGIVVIVGVLAALAVAGARLLLGVVTRVFGGSAWELTRGRVLRTAGKFLVLGVGLPMLGSYGLDQLREGFLVPLLVDLLGAALLVATVYGQAILLADFYLEPRADGAVADLDAVDARLATLGAQPAQPDQPAQPALSSTPGEPAWRRWIWIGVVAMLLPMVASAGIAVANPLGAASIRTGGSIGAVAALWPAGQHPIIATNSGVRYCDDDLCDSYVERRGMASVSGIPTTSIGVDGTAVTVAGTGGMDSGGPYIEYARCTRAACQHEWLPFRASAKEQVGRSSFAGAPAPDGSTWFAAATTPPTDGAGPVTFTLLLIRCTQVPCTKPERHVVGTMRQVSNDDNDIADNRRARLSIGADGRPVASFWFGSGVRVVTCAPVTCAAPQASDARAVAPDASWSTPASLHDDLVALTHGKLDVGETSVSLAGEGSDGSGAVAVDDSHVYATLVEANTTRPAGPRITFGEQSESEQAESWQRVLWRCERALCADPQRIPLGPVRGGIGYEVIATHPDGRVLIYGDDRAVLYTPPR